MLLKNIEIVLDAPAKSPWLRNPANLNVVGKYAPVFPALVELK